VAAPIPVKSLCVLLFAKKISYYETQQLILGTGTAWQSPIPDNINFYD